ncbi:YobI family P-loop NTPase, partial [Chishuiella changwenlii]
MYYKESIIKFCNIIIVVIENFKIRFEDKKEEDNVQFSHLNSIHLKEDEIKNYSEKLDWGIKNKAVKNIAITGSYGSGKSSIIKSFIKNENLDKKSLSISFANFENNDDLIIKDEIEFNIVNQILYSEKKSKLRNSRFKRISNKSWIEKSISILFILVFLYTVINLFFPS